MKRRWQWQALGGPVALLLAFLCAEAAARPDSPGTVVVELGSGAHVDWTRGVLVASGAAAGDLRSPSSELARVKAERQARDAARARLRRLARELPLADGRELGAAIEGEDAADERLDRALDAILDEEVEHASDGSVVLSAALPLEAARAAVFGAMEAPEAREGPTAVLIDAGKHLKRPVLGLKLAAGKERYAGPTVFATNTDVLGPDRLGARTVKLKATSFRGGALHLDGGAAGKLAEARAAGALVVVEIAAGKKRKDRKDDKERRR